MKETNIYGLSKYNIYEKTGLSASSKEQNREVIDTVTYLQKWYLHWEVRRIRRNQNVLALVVGPTGSGKSYHCLSAALEYNPDFNVDSVAFNTHDFLELVQEQHAGDVNIYDDAGLGMNAREWYTQQSIVFGKVAQSMRFKKIISYITVPDMKFIEGQSRSLVSILFQAHDSEQGLFYVKFPRPQRNISLRTRNIYFVYPRIRVGDSTYKVMTMKYPLPPDKLVQAYEKKRKEVIDKYYDEYIKSLEPKVRKKLHPNSLRNLQMNRHYVMSHQNDRDDANAD